MLVFKEKGEKKKNYPEEHVFLSFATHIDNSTRRLSASAEVIRAAHGAPVCLRSHLVVTSAFGASRWGWFGYR